MSQQQANTKHCYYVSEADLPLSCPTDAMRLWDSHPKVYLSFNDVGEANCPYCSARFILSETDSKKLSEIVID